MKSDFAQSMRDLCLKSGREILSVFEEGAKCVFIKSAFAVLLLFVSLSVTTRYTMAAELISYIRTFEESYPVTSLVVSPSGDWLASSSVYSGNVVVRRTVDGNDIAHLIIPVSAPRFNSMSVSPDGRWLASCTGDHGLVRIFDTQTWSLEREISQSYPGGCASVSFSPNGQKLAVAYERPAAINSFAPAIVILNTQTWTKSSQVTSVSVSLMSVAFLSDEILLGGGASYTPDFLHECGSVIVWNSEAREPPTSLRLFNEHRVNAVGVIEGGRWLAGAAIFVDELPASYVGNTARLSPLDGDIAGLLMGEHTGSLAKPPKQISLGMSGIVTAIVADPSVRTGVVVIDDRQPRLVAFSGENPSVRQLVRLSGRTYAASGVSRTKMFAISREKYIDLFHINN